MLTWSVPPLSRAWLLSPSAETVTEPIKSEPHHPSSSWTLNHTAHGEDPHENSQHLSQMGFASSSMTLVVHGVWLVPTPNSTNVSALRVPNKAHRSIFGRAVALTAQACIMGGTPRAETHTRRLPAKLQTPAIPDIQRTQRLKKGSHWQRSQAQKKGPRLKRTRT